MPRLGESPTGAVHKKKVENTMLLHEARTLADELVQVMRPYCERIEIGGSIRREKPDNIKDIEIVCIPQWEAGTLPALPQTATLFDEPEPETETLINRLHQWATSPAALLWLRWIQAGKSELIDVTPKADGKYWRAVRHGAGCKVDIFLTAPERWGATFLIRTGSAEFSQAVMTRAKTTGYRFQEGAFCRVTESGCYEAIPVLEESDVFQWLRLAYLPPHERTDASALRVTTIRPNS
jgi:DNA polymerase/3'-5' exonuclease PolX